jgi:hypothetical protein
VFLLETKNLEGITQIREGIPHLERRHYPDRLERHEWIRKQALREAVALKNEIGDQTGIRWVQAIVVLWSDFPQAVVEDGQCVFVHGSELVTWLAGRDQKLDRRRVALIAARLDELRCERATRAN